MSLEIGIFAVRMLWRSNRRANVRSIRCLFRVIDSLLLSVRHSIFYIAPLTRRCRLPLPSTSEVL